MYSLYLSKVCEGYYMWLGKNIRLYGKKVMESWKEVKMNSK